MTGATDEELMAMAQLDFERHFGKGDDTKSSMDLFGGERVVVVENHVKRAFYSTNIELIKVFNLQGEID